MQLADTENIEEQRRRLRRMKQIPLALLAIMALIFIWGHWLAPAAPWVGYVMAFAEAAMIGALADWFAVVALFRHPLGIPVPHTAIIPTRKDQIGASLGRFVAENFLNAKSVNHQLQGRAVAAGVCRWSLAHADSLADGVLRLLRWLAQAIAEPEYRQFLSRNVLARVESLPTAPAVGRILDLLARNSHHQELLSELLRVGVSFLEDHKESLRDHMRQGGPWWLPEFVDKKVYNQVIDRLQNQMLALVLDLDHELRGRFDEVFRTIAGEMMDSESLRARRFEQVKTNIINDETVRAYAEEMWGEIAQVIADSLDNNRVASHAFISDLVRRMANDALDDKALLATFDEWLRSAAAFLAAELGQEASSLINNTVRAWDARETSERIELQIGSDLQFIRINGTLVGGLVGLSLYQVVRWFG